MSDTHHDQETPAPPSSAPPAEWMFMMGEFSGNMKALTASITSLQRTTAASISEVKASVTGLATRVDTLESFKDRGSGQVSVLNVLVTTGLAIAVGVAVYLIKGS